ncbi:MAG: Pimeloyl-ACP methyl ester carboxylesterase, partial [Frankiales bacterium]|nr:Pimeloyl-ACP methyl ester carboxylesterase [Frankiales bacterium]
PVPVPVPSPVPPAGRHRSVTTEDGVELAVTEFGATDATATVVLAHGYVQSSALWAGQVRDLVDTRPDLRVVTYDHRGHGRSGRTTRDRAHLEQLGRDLALVLDAVAPTGPVVVGGHSMGGMTVMALAEQRPELFGDRIVGAAFVGTSSGGLAGLTYGLPAPVARVVTRLLPRLNERAVAAELAGKARKVGAMDARMIYPKGVDTGLVQWTLDVHRDCSAETVAAFLPTFSTHERLAALEAVAHVPALVVVGDQDVLCPVEHSRAIARALPSSELVVYPGVGHMVHLERRSEVSRHLVALVDRALAASSPPAA